MATLATTADVADESAVRPATALVIVVLGLVAVSEAGYGAASSLRAAIGDRLAEAAVRSAAAPQAIAGNPAHAREQTAETAVVARQALDEVREVTARYRDAPRPEPFPAKPGGLATVLLGTIATILAGDIAAVALAWTGLAVIDLAYLCRQYSPAIPEGRAERR